MRSNFDDVGDFHEKFGLDNVTHHGAGLREIRDDLMSFRIKFLKEELQEFEDAYKDCNEASMFDALLDLVYVALGTAHLRGYPWQKGWNEVQRANMSKQRAATDGSDSVRMSKWDVIKPPGWRPPDIESILASNDVCSQCKCDLTKIDVKEVYAYSTHRVDLHCICGAYLGSRSV